jgi:carbon monoxide dehydrogenase subunit G
MPEREAKFSVKAPPEEVWRFIRDIESLCACIPGVERVKLLDPRAAELTVTEKVGIVPLTVDLTARIDAEEPPRRLHASAKAAHLTMEIDVRLKPAGPGTEMVGLIKVTGEGQLKLVVDRLFEKRATERTAQFAECLGKRFGGAAPAPTAAPSRRGRLRRMIEWLRRRLTSSS